MLDNAAVSQFVLKKKKVSPIKGDIQVVCPGNELETQNLICIRDIPSLLSQLAVFVTDLFPCAFEMIH